MVIFSARRLVILAAICFGGLVLLQFIWMRSAYEGELALYVKEKKQFESELVSGLQKDPAFITTLKRILDSLNGQRKLSPAVESDFIDQFSGRLNASKEHHRVSVSGFVLTRHEHNRPANGANFILKSGQNAADSKIQMEKAGKICVSCLMDPTGQAHEQYNYGLLIFYDREKPTIYKRLGWVIAGCFVFLVLLGLLFGRVLKKYSQEKKLSEAKNDFINNLSHEIQTPLFAIQMANRLIRENLNSHKDQRPLIEIIEKETKQLKAHAGKILELASLENQNVVLQLERVDLNSFIEEKRPTLELMLHAKAGELEVHYHAHPLYISVDRVHLNNILLSLIENSIKYTDTTPIVKIQTGEVNEMCYLSISDNGIGIDAKYLSKVFDKFYRVPLGKHRTTAGFGLGLSYVDQIVNLHKGKITIESQVDKGTAVTIFLTKPAPDV